MFLLNRPAGSLRFAAGAVQNAREVRIMALLEKLDLAFGEDAAEFLRRA
jgi:hypothetical protein